MQPVITINAVIMALFFLCMLFLSILLCGGGAAEAEKIHLPQ